MATRVNGATLNGNATTLANGAYQSTSTSVSVQSGDVVVAFAGWETANTSGVTFSDDNGTVGTWVTGSQVTHATSTTLHGQFGYLICTGSATITPRFIFNAALLIDVPEINAEVFRPAGGATLAVGTSSEAPITGTDTTTSSGDSITPGSITASAAGVGFMGLREFHGGSWTTATGWTLTDSTYHASFFQILSGSGTLSSNAKYSVITEWVGGMLYFKETGGGPAPGGGSLTLTGASGSMDLRITPRFA